jgi:DNA polymerase IV
MKRICHIDLNAFFCQCEILRDPSLKGKPIAVGHDAKRGVISTCSYEARKFNVSSGMSSLVAKKLCPQLILVPGHYSLYEEYSRKFIGFLKERFPVLEQASIDECYIDMTDEIQESDENAFLFDLQMTIYRKVQLKCSIGLSYNKFLAKMASDMKKPLGITILEKQDLKQRLYSLDIDKFFGIGKKTAPLLQEAGILTIGDLAEDEKGMGKKILGSAYDYFRLEARGEIGDDFVDNSQYDPKSMSAERTFHDDVTSYEEIHNMISLCVKEVVYELKCYHKLCLVLSLKLRDTSFHTKSRRKALDVASDDVAYLTQQALAIFDDFYSDEPLRLLGVCAEKVVPKEKDDLIERLNKELKTGAKLIQGDELEK